MEKVRIKFIYSNLDTDGRSLKGIFKPFMKENSGTNLDLNLSASIIKEHNGKTYIENGEPDSTFTIELPAVSS